MEFCDHGTKGEAIKVLTANQFINFIMTATFDLNDQLTKRHNLGSSSISKYFLDVIEGIIYEIDYIIWEIESCACNSWTFNR